MKAFLPVLLVISVIVVSGCTQQLPSGNTSLGDRIQPDGTILRPDGTIIKPDGTMVKPNGVMVKPDGTMLPPEGSPAGTTVSEDGTIVKPDGTMIKPDGTMIGPGGEVTSPEPSSGASAGYTGQLLAGSVTPYIRYNEADFQKARSEGKVIAIYFRASWCPICNAERPNILAAFNEMNYPDVVGFEAHISDQETTPTDQALIQQYQIPYQHVTLILDSSGSVALKSLQPLGKEGLKSAIANARGG